MLSPNQVNICIAYDQKLIAEGIASILSTQKEFAYRYLIKNNIEQLKEVLLYKHFDIVIFELCYISPHAIDLIKTIKKHSNHLKLLVISGLIAHNNLEKLMHHADGYILRTCGADKVVLAIREIIESGKYLCPQLIDTLLDDTSQGSDHLDLTSREKEILSLWFTLDDTSEIAKTLNISKTTVRTHLKNIRDKFGDSNRIKMLIYACQANMLKENSRPVCSYCKSICTAPNETIQFENHHNKLS